MNQRAPRHAVVWETLPLSAAGEPAEAILVQVHGAPPSHWGLSTGPCAFRSVSLHLHV